MGPETSHEENKAAIGLAAAGPGPEEVKTLTIDLTPPKHKPTRKEIGRARRRYMTSVQGTVNACGHKFHATNTPTTNCLNCWEAYFRVHEGVVQGVQSIINTFGEEELVKAHGVKFLKRYKQYAAIVEEEQREATSKEGIVATSQEV